MDFNASLAATAVGSFPHRDPDAACDLVLENFPEIPVWPQLPLTSPNEQMEIQFSEGIPCTVIERDKGRMFIDTSGDPSAALEKFYEQVLADNLDYFAVSEDFSRGIYALERRLARIDRSGLKYIKMQVIGPVSFGLTIVDENKRAIYYNELFRDVAVKALALKARWQLRKFKPLCEKRICFIDEPILSAFGSSTYVSVHRGDVVRYLQELVAAIHQEGGWAGIHCCGNTEWTIPIDAGVDIINFDAHGYGDSILLYAEQIGRFLKGGGVLAWGIVPTSEKVFEETTESLVARFDALVNDLAARGKIDRELILSNALITASCGTGSRPLEQAERITRETRRVSDKLKEKHG
ncbi:MAG: hypothetical protein KJ726_03750 [Verrucomicrobia bacterium]|nr:hypothetical protein [Verrucomicrobiota bacterium]MBU1909140.1 hypothetical protein [Verrucomicrobiota bacterium]